MSSPKEPNWRVGNHVPRNVYFRNEPVAMVAGPKDAAEALAAYIVKCCNEAEDRLEAKLNG